MQWIPATEERALHVAANLRKQDVIEVFCSHGLQPHDAVMSSWKNSPDCRCIGGDDGTAVGIAGVASGGQIWMLATDGLLATASHRRQLVRLSKAWVDGLIADGAGPLHNWALAKNVNTLRWLQFLGFRLDPPAPLGPCAELFCYFERSA